MSKSRSSKTDADRKTHSGDRASQCPHDGSTLDDRGYCWQAGGYPIVRWRWDPDGARGHGLWVRDGYACPFVCPICRHGLEWDGGCFGCHGSATPKDRNTWTFPGDAYAVVKGHWMVQDGPMKAGRLEDVTRGFAIVKRVMDGVLTAEQAHEKLHEEGLVRR